jgi:hypothetical protein
MKEGRQNRREEGGREGKEGRKEVKKDKKEWRYGWKQGGKERQMNEHLILVWKQICLLFGRLCSEFILSFSTAV